MGGVRTGGGVLGWGVLGDGCREGDMGEVWLKQYFSYKKS